MEARLFGPVGNAAFFRACFEGKTDKIRNDPLFDLVFMSGVDIAPFANNYTTKDEDMPTMAYIAWYGNCICTHPDQTEPNRAHAAAGSWRDLTAPQIPNSRVMAQNRARARLVQCVTKLLSPDVLQTVSNARAATYEKLFPCRASEWNAIDSMDAEIAMRHLKALAVECRPAFRTDGVSMLVHVYLAVLKRGFVSLQIAQKISNHLSAKFSIHGLTIDENACKVFYTAYGDDINESNIEAITAAWCGSLPATALLTAAQAAGSRLTALSVTGRAIKVFEDFNWSRIQNMYNDEWANLLAAMQVVGNNVWYSFSKNTTDVSSTKYKSISYVAKELLIQVNKEVSLKNYQGWTRFPKLQFVVDPLIADYVTAKTRNIAYDVNKSDIPANARVDEIRDFIKEHPDLYM